VNRLPVGDGTSLAYSHLPGSEPGILFCAGFNSDMQGNKALGLEDWCRGQGIQFTRFDYYGHGESDGAMEQGTIGRWRDDALAILDSVTTGPQLIVGSSMGGWIMLLAALARPDRITGLVGIAAAPDFTQSLLAQRLDDQQRRQLEETGFCDMPNDYDEPYRISRQLLDEANDHLLLGRSIDVDVPVRLLHGQRDADVPWENALAIARQLGSADVEVQLIKSGDHRLSEPVDIRRLIATVAALRHQMT
jgi:pimeloyl-ACP methyl ester carboxylesterase